jgi:lipoprotein NlpI
VESFGSCVALKPDHAACLNNLSIAKRKEALTNSALKSMRDTQRAENTAESLFILARKYKDEGLLSEEERTYKECLKRDGKYAPCHYGLFEIYSSGQKRQHAEVACKNFLKYGSVEDFPTESETCDKFLSAKSY